MSVKTRLKPKQETSQYLELSRSWTYSLIFVFPLMLIYQFVILGTAATGQVRTVNGAQALLAWVLAFVGIDSYIGFFMVASLVVAFGVYWDARKNNRKLSNLKREYFLVMLLESTVYAFLFAITVSFITEAIVSPFFVSLVPFSLSILDEIALGIGAGVYEEVVFRVFLISGVIKLYEAAGEKPELTTYVFVILASSVIFALAHATPGNMSTALQPTVFTFRTVGGCIFAVLYLVRGFGVAVYTHALYDVFYVLSII